MKKLLITFLFLVSTLSWSASTQLPASRLRKGTGAPSGSECATASDVAKVYLRSDPAATFSTLYICANIEASTYSWEGPYGAGGGGGGGGALTMTVGSGDPSASCTAPSASALTKYYDTTGKNLWTCTDTNTWRLDTLVDPSAVMLITGKAGTAPGTPSTGFVYVYTDSTQKGLSAKDDTGQITRTVKPTDCSGTGHLQKINADGTVTCSADSGGGGSAHPIFISPNGFQVVATGTKYSGPGGAIPSTNDGYDLARGVFPASGTISHFCAGIDHVTTQPGDGSLVFTMIKNGVATSLTVTVPAGTAPPYYICDTTHTVAVTADTDAISFSIVNNSPSLPSAFPATMSYLFQ